MPQSSGRPGGGRVVLVTGVAADPGRQFARRLADCPEVDRVIGIDVTPPVGDIGAMTFVRADIRNPVIAKVVVREHVDTVVHLGLRATAPRSAGRSVVKENNVIGTMQLLAACQQAPGLKHLVVRSGASVYGASPSDPAKFTEEMSARRKLFGLAKDIAEAEGYVRGFARRRPDVRLVTLRPAAVIGAGVDSPLTRYFTMPVLPTVLGFNPRLQFVHSTDLEKALLRSTLSQAQGTFNVAGDGVLMLTQAARRLGRPTLPIPPVAFASLAPAFRQARQIDVSTEQMEFLTYGRGLDTARMRQELGLEPAYTTAEAFADFAGSVRAGVLDPRRVRSAESALTGLLGGGSTMIGGRDG